MNELRRIVVVAVILAGLAGCNNVVSNEPWFTATDTEGAPELRDGLWVRVTDDDCRPNLQKPAERWPDCADPMYVRDHEWLMMRWDDAPSRRRRVFEGWEHLPAIIAAGDPAILQLDEGIEPPASEADSNTIKDDEPHWRYSYAGLRPTQRDREGRVVEFEWWSVQCGPLPPRELKAGVDYPVLGLGDDNVTEHPFPGLTIVGQKCIAESVDALRGAAVSSRAIAELKPIRWVRDGWH